VKPYPKNPRQITVKQFGDLEKWLDQLGDLSGIVHNLETDEIIGGNQRARVFGLMQSEAASIEMTRTLPEPDRQGTVGEGYIHWRDGRYGYRQVRWDAETSDLANLVANHAGGTWDWDILANEWDEEMLSLAGFEDWELTGHTADVPEAAPPDDFKEYDEDIETEHVCPKCGYKWSGGVNLDAE
jgi:hypothetical protein